MCPAVTQIEIQAVPFGPDEHGGRWDLFSGPDLYYEVYDPDGARLHVSEVADDVRPRDLPLTLDAGFRVEQSGQHVLQLMDADLIDDEVVGRVDFEPDRILGGRSASAPARSVRLSEERLTLQLVLEWTAERSD